MILSLKNRKLDISCLFLIYFGLGFSLFIPATAEAQVLYGTIVGNIKDSTGAVVPGATVSATNVGTNQTREAISNDAGMYTFSNLQPGNYTLKVVVQGFKEFVQMSVQVTVNNISRVDVTLDVGARTDTVTVSAQSAVLQTDKADVHKELNATDITNLPTNMYRNYQSLIDLVPGSTPSGFQNASVDTPDRALTTNINGVVRSNNNTRQDGALSIMPWLPHHAAYVAPQESIQTVNISTNSFDAEQGLAGGASITVQTKSGTNNFHGVAFEYLRNSAFSAENFFTPVGSGVPKSIINIFGGNVGGPVIKDKLFFFVNYEGMRERDSASAYATVATAAMRTGDLSATGTTIYDPATGDSTGKGRTPFAGGKIPASRLDPSAQQMLALVPLPNVPGATWVNNYYGSAPWVFNRDLWDFKGDWVRTPTNTIWMKVSMMRSLCDGQYLLKEAGGPGLPSSNGPGTGTVHTYIGTLGGYYAITPKLLVDGTFGAMRYVNHVRQPDYGVNFGLDVLKIPGTNGPDERQSGKPIFSIGGGYTSLGLTDTWIPVDRWDYTYTWTGNVSWSHGKHDIRFGPDINRFGMNHWQPEAGSGPRGSFSFDGGTTALNGGPSPNRFNNMAAFLLGLANSVNKSLQYYDPMSTREWQIAMYIRDRWQVTKDLTLSLGVRWENYPIMDRGFHGIERYDPSNNKVYIGGYGGVDWNADTTASKKLFAPRFGLAYRLAKQGVVRMGYGITFDPYNLGRPMRSPYPAVPQLALEGPRSFIPYGPVSNGIPPITVPDITQGVIDILGTYTVTTLPKGPFHRGNIQSWNVTYERPLPWNLVGSVGYVGTRSVNIVQRGGVPINNSPLGTGNAGRPLNIKWGRTANTTILQPWQDSKYNSLQASLDRRFAAGLMLKTAYTWSHCVGSNTSPFGLPELFGLNRGPCRDDNSTFDRRHNFRTAFVYDLPWGPGRKWANGGVVGAITGGWQINGIFTAVTGTPFGVGSSSSLLNAAGTSQTPDLVKSEVKKLGGIGVGVPFYDPSAFKPVTTPLVYGNWGSSTLTGPGMINMDFGIFRAFKITEGKELSFRAEGFNIFNTPHFNNPSDTTASNMTFNADGSIKSVNNFMNITSARDDQRIFRFGLRFSF
jgi:hypothetical protein